MTEVEKIKAEIERLQLCTMDEHMNFYSEEAQGEYNALAKLEAFIDTECQQVCPVEESVSKDFEMALAEMVGKAQKCVVEPWVVAAQWKDELIKLVQNEEPVSEELEEAAVCNRPAKLFPNCESYCNACKQFKQAMKDE